MNYRHAYHAGGFSDVMKHGIECLILDYLTKKEKGFVYLDTHAGIGHYDLHSDESSRGQEYRQGIHKIMALPHVPAEVQIYRDIVSHYYDAPQKLFYPGSPLIAKHFLREQDKLILNEFHPEDSQLLKQVFRREPQVHCHQRDAYEFLPAMLPPEPRRGLILIDPPYEERQELPSAVKLLKEGLDKFAQGVYLLWYPIKDYRNESAVKVLRQARLPADSLHLEYFHQKPETDSNKLIGSGVVVVNPPWPLKEQATVFLEQMVKTLSKVGEGYQRITIL